MILMTEKIPKAKRQKAETAYKMSSEICPFSQKAFPLPIPDTK